jgi:hypothetical protein
MTAFKVNVEYTYSLDESYYFENRKLNTIVFGENIGEAFTKTLQEIAKRELSKQTKVVEKAKQENVFPEPQKDVSITKFSLEKIYENVIV